MAVERVGDRQETERALEEAALTLLEREGVLAGLNLRKVAELAGQNRGLVYHYYGSRRDLLRKALRRYAARWNGVSHAYARQPIERRVRRLLREMRTNRRAADLILLLAIDGDCYFPSVGEAREYMRAYERDVEEGRLAEDVDLTALQCVLLSAAFGYVELREALAERHDIQPSELDKRFEDLFVRMVNGLRPRG